MDKAKAAYEIGRNVFMLRRRAGLSQGQLAEAIEVSQPKISILERGEALPTLEQLVQLCQALEARPDQLLLGVVS